MTVMIGALTFIIFGALVLYGIGALLGAPDLPPRRAPSPTPPTPPGAEPSKPAQNESNDA